MPEERVDARRETGDGRDCSPRAVSYLAGGTKKNQTGKDVFYRLTSTLSPLSGSSSAFFRLPSHRKRAPVLPEPVVIENPLKLYFQSSNLKCIGITSQTLTGRSL